MDHSISTEPLLGLDWVDLPPVLSKQQAVLGEVRAFSDALWNSKRQWSCLGIMLWIVLLFNLAAWA